MTAARTFRLAPMSGVIRVLTLIVLVIPLLLFGAGLYASPRLTLPAALCGGLFLVVWLFYRPTRFELGPQALDIVFPLRRISIPAASLAGATALDSAAFRASFGWAARIGVGGLWGVFGWLYTGKRGLCDVYLSRIDRFAVVERRDGRPLLISPEDLDEFVRVAQGTGGALSSAP